MSSICQNNSVTEDKLSNVKHTLSLGPINWTFGKLLSHTFSFPLRFLIQKLFWASDKGFKIASCVAPHTRYIHSNLELLGYVAIVPFKAFTDSSRGGIVDRHVKCAQIPMHLVESSVPSGSRRLYSSMNFGSRN